MLILSGKSQACSPVATPLGIVLKSLSSLPSGQVGTPYFAELAAQFGAEPYTWSVVSGLGAPPPGLQLNVNSGLLSGTPLTQGSYTFTVQIADNNQNIGSGVGTITIGTAATSLAVTTPANLQAATQGTAYSFPLSAAGGTPPYHWSENGLICPTSIPGLDGLCVADNGALQGTPSEAASNPVSFVMQVTDSSTPAQTATMTASLAVLPQNLPPQVYSVAASPSSVPAQGTATLTCTAVDPQQATLAYSWRVTGGTVSGSGSTVTWTAPSTPGGYTATCTVNSSLNLSASNSILIQVSSSVLTSTISPASGIVSSTQFTVSGSGATASKGVTGTVTLPNSTTTTLHATADSSGKYTFVPFAESVTGVYSEVDSDDQTGAKSNAISWTVNPSTPAGINLQLYSIPSGTSSIYVRTNNSVTVISIAVSQRSLNQFIPQPAGTYDVRVIATGSTSPGNVIAGAYAPGVQVSGTTALTLSLSPESVTLDSSTPSTVAAGSTFTATVDISDPAHWIDGIAAGMEVNSLISGQNASCIAVTFGKYTCTSSSLVAPTTAGSMSMSFWAYQNIAGPLSTPKFGLNWTMQANVISGISLQVSSIPSNVTSLYVWVGNSVTVIPVSSGQTSVSQTIGLAAGTNDVRVVGTAQGNAVAGAYAAGVQVSGLTPLTLSMSAETVTLDSSTPSTVAAGSTLRPRLTLPIRLTGWMALLDGFRSIRIRPTGTQHALRLRPGNISAPFPLFRFLLQRVP